MASRRWHINYAYMKLASADEDGNGKNGAPCGAGCYLRVQSGMYLRWEQNNQYSCTVSLDIEFTDGTALRDQPLVDNFGVSVHPAQRTCFSGWRSIAISRPQGCCRVGSQHFLLSFE